jgi:hypothetical protein
MSIEQFKPYLKLPLRMDHDGEPPDGGIWFSGHRHTRFFVTSLQHERRADHRRKVSEGKRAEERRFRTQTIVPGGRPCYCESRAAWTHTAR